MIKIKTNEPLTGLSTMMTPGLADYVVEWETEEDLRVLMTAPCYDIVRQGGIMPIGQGSNLLFVTSHYNGALLLSRGKRIERFEARDGKVRLKVDAGVMLDELVAYCCKENLWGIENLTLIPGTVGAAAVQNVGAYGVEFKDVVLSVNTFNLVDCSARRYGRHEINYDYRDSIFKSGEMKNRVVVTSVIVELQTTPSPHLDYGNLAEKVGEYKNDISFVRNAVRVLRQSKLPEVGKIGSAGSFFKNPIISEENYACVINNVRATGLDVNTIPAYKVSKGRKLSAAWMIDKAGWKGVKINHAGVWKNQPLVLVNADGEASGADVAALAAAISEDVNKKFGVKLETEVEYLY